MVFIASDHAGFELKKFLKPYLTRKGYSVKDLGPKTFKAGDDYTTYASKLARAVKQDTRHYGIMIGGSGEGEAMAVNRFKGVRAGVYYGEPLTVITFLRKHNNANVLALGARLATKEEAAKAVSRFLTTPFSEEKRHRRRNRALDRLG